MDFITTDDVDSAESSFYDSSLLQTEYMQRYREVYYLCRENDFCNGYRLNVSRNYLSILNYFSEVYQYRESHAASFSKRIKDEPSQWKKCESTVSELIVYHNYLRPMYEGLIRSISLEADECDVIIERCDRSKYYLECFCLMPEFTEDKNGVIDIRSHTQTAFSSVRQKLLTKVKKQGQFLKDRENFAVIELNDDRIAHEFTVLSSISDGYKVSIDRNTMNAVSEGYDWKNSVFKLTETKFLKGIIWFNLGNYRARKILINPHYRKENSCQ